MSPKDVSKPSTVHVDKEHDAVETPANGTANYPSGWWSWQLSMCMIIVGLSLGLYGYDNNFASPLMQLPLFISKYQSPAISFTATNLNLLICVPLVGAAIGTFIAPPLMKRFGRKYTLIIAYFSLNTPGSFLQLFAPNMAALVAGRFWNYVGVSVLTATAPLYLAELVPAHVRGRAIGFCNAGIAAVGILATTLVWGTEQIDDERQFIIPLAVQAGCPIVLGLLTFLCVESPAWDMQRNNPDSARRSLMLLRNNKVQIVESEILMYQAAIRAGEQQKKAIRFWDILNRANLNRTLTSGALLCLSQVGGQILILTYSTIILVQSGVGQAFQITVIITCLQFLGTLVGPVLVDKAGRRPVALMGFSILFILNLAAGSIATAGLTTKSQQLGLASVFIIFGFFNAVSFGSLSLVLPTELSTLSLREPTVAWSVFWSYVTAVITTFAVPQLMSPDAANLGAKTSFIFAGCVFLTIIWSYFYIPETKARTAAEVDEMYTIRLPMREWRNYRCQSLGPVGV